MKKYLFYAPDEMWVLFYGLETKGGWEVFSVTHKKEGIWEGTGVLYSSEDTARLPKLSVLQCNLNKNTKQKHE